MSGLICVVLEFSTDMEQPPKSDRRAPLMASIGLDEPSNVSACKGKCDHYLDKDDY